ncbi:MAG: undecaprenyldiphospho-muramoylpentapeptide beta-N-acetylglucosaminyltransferase [Fusobacteriaceae bacterium]
MKKVILTTGGTGGHIYPALSVAEELKENGIDVLFIGTSLRMEKDIVPKFGYRFIGLNVQSPRNFVSIVNFIKAIFQSIKIVKKESPDAIIGFGNYISVPTLVAGIILRKKIYIQEQNATVGMTNRLFFRFCKKIFLAFEASYDDLPIKYEEKILVTGNPLRKDILNIDRETERENLKVSPKEKVLLITGGSLGAKEINDAVLQEWNRIYENKNLRIYWATGEKLYSEVNKQIDRIKTKDVIKPYFDNMVNIMAAADLVVCRAGALTVSELIELEKPSVLIPYRYKKVGQMENAKILEDVQGTYVYTGSKGHLAIDRALDLIENQELLDSISLKIKSLKRKNAAKEIVTELDIWRI